MKIKSIILLAALLAPCSLLLPGCSGTTATVKDANVSYSNGKSTTSAGAGEIDYSSAPKN